jgi:hypothetical protein
VHGNTKQWLTYSLAVIFLSLPSLTFAQAQTGGATGQAPQASGDDAIYCRPPERLANSNFSGPKVCRTVGEWKALRAQGLDISADGQNTVPTYNGGSQGQSLGLGLQP